MNSPIASLSMYDWPETREALERFWQSIAQNLAGQGIETPKELSSSEAVFEIWRDPDLLVGQTCGWPYANKLRGTVIPFARLDYGVTGCPPGYYNCVFIGQSHEDASFLERRETLLEAPKIAINGDDSQSGFHVFREITGTASCLTIPNDQRLITGAHRESVKAVARGDANIAAIDAIAFELAKRHEPEAVSKITIIGHSRPKPGLPLITALKNANMIPALVAALERSIDALSGDDRETLMIKSLLRATDSDYDCFLD